MGLSFSKGLARLLNDVFEFGPPLPPARFVGHVASKLLHRDRCNHLPPVQSGELFDGVEAAQAEGYRSCVICFGTAESLPYPGYLSYRIEGLRDARLLELVYPPSADLALQARLDRLGAEVLEFWPLELSGFDYDFRVIEAEQPIAVSLHGRRDPSSEDHQVYESWSAHQQVGADLMAIAWFSGLPPGRREVDRARVAMAKIQHATGSTDHAVAEHGQAMLLHERLWLFESERFQPGDPRQVFVALDGE